MIRHNLGHSNQDDQNAKSVTILDIDFENLTSIESNLFVWFSGSQNSFAIQLNQKKTNINYLDYFENKTTKPIKMDHQNLKLFV